MVSTCRGNPVKVELLKSKNYNKVIRKTGVIPKKNMVIKEKNVSSKSYEVYCNTR